MRFIIDTLQPDGEDDARDLPPYFQWRAVTDNGGVVVAFGAVKPTREAVEESLWSFIVDLKAYNGKPRAEFFRSGVQYR